MPACHNSHSTQLYSINLKYPDYCQKPKPDGIWKQNYEKSKTVKEEIFWIKDDILQPIWMVVWRHRTSAEGVGPVMAKPIQISTSLSICNFSCASFLALATLETTPSYVLPWHKLPVWPGLNVELNDALSHSGEKPFLGPGFVNNVTKNSCQEESHRTTWLLTLEKSIS